MGIWCCILPVHWISESVEAVQCIYLTLCLFFFTVPWCGGPNVFRLQWVFLGHSQAEFLKLIFPIPESLLGVEQKSCEVCPLRNMSNVVTSASSYIAGQSSHAVFWVCDFLLCSSLTYQMLNGMAFLCVSEFFQEDNYLMSCFTTHTSQDFSTNKYCVNWG